MNDSNSLAHTKWNCKYHIVFAPKYRRQVIYGKLKAEIGQILRKLCEQKEIEINRSECMPRPYTHANKHPAKDLSSLCNRILKGEKFTDDI